MANASSTELMPRAELQSEQEGWGSKDTRAIVIVPSSKTQYQCSSNTTKQYYAGQSQQVFFILLAKAREFNAQQKHLKVQGGQAVFLTHLNQGQPKS